MSAIVQHVEADMRVTTGTVPNGGSMAAVLASGIGSFAVGIFVLLHASGLFSAPALYTPAGGVSGRTTFALLVWGASWWVLQRRWKERFVSPRRVLVATLAMVAVSLLATFPPFWAAFS